MRNWQVRQVRRVWKVWQFVLAALALLVYALGSHLLMVHAAAKPWAVAVLFGPLVLAIAASGWQRRHAPTLAFCGVVLLTLVWVVGEGGVADVNRLYVLQHAGIHLALAWAFALTLRPGGKALIEALAERIHPHFPPPLRAYTRRLTAAWVLYFLAMVLLSGLIYAFAPWPWWSLFCNLATPLLAGVMFVGEHLLRYRWHPEFERITMRRALQAYRRFGQAEVGPAP